MMRPALAIMLVVTVIFGGFPYASAALLVMPATVGAEDRYWAVIPGERIGGARLGMTRRQVDQAIGEIPCADGAFATDFDGDRLVRIATACGGAVRLENGIQVGSAFRRVVRQFGQPDSALVVKDGEYDGAVAYWLPYPVVGIAFRVVVYGGDITVQSIRVIPAAVSSAGPRE